MDVHEGPLRNGSHSYFNLEASLDLQPDTVDDARLVGCRDGTVHLHTESLGICASLCALRQICTYTPNQQCVNPFCDVKCSMAQM